MLEEVLQAAALEPGQVVIDGTFGYGGYSTAFVEAGAKVLGIDRDPTAIEGGQALVARAAGDLTRVQGRFSELDELARENAFETVDAVVLDIGVSSMQLDQAARGFSFQQDGPLDMRMSGEGLSAFDVINDYSAKDIAAILSQLGEEKRAVAIARAIDLARRDAPIETTLQLAKIVEQVLGRNPRDPIHPATRSFQGIRIYVNGELHQLALALGSAERILKPGGRVVVVSFHSLEDRIVKRFLTDRSRTQAGGSRHAPQQSVPDPTFNVTSRRVVTASEDEIASNPRARSAKLRAAVRTSANARSLDPLSLSVPRAGGDPMADKR
jgi:16S rRNA (cytosine1402-N4)-methyltransferase